MGIFAFFTFSHFSFLLLIGKLFFQDEASSSTSINCVSPAASSRLQRNDPSIKIVSSTASDPKSLASPVQNQVSAMRQHRSASMVQSAMQHPFASVPIQKSLVVGQSSAPMVAHGFPHLSILPKINLSPAEQTGRFHPYRLTFKVHQDDSTTVARSTSASILIGRSERVKPQQVTQPTFCCPRKSPIAFSTIVPADSKDSVCAVWPQITVSPLDAKLNILMMGGCNVRARWMGVKYSTATTSLGSMLTTDSVYWEHSRRLQRLAAAAVVASTSNSLQPSQEIIAKETERSDLKIVEEESEEKPEAVEMKEEEKEKAGETEEQDAQKTNLVTSTTSSRQRLKDILTAGGGLGSMNGNGQTKKVVVCNGGYKTNEAYTYVRGRGRGRYVCERCGIRCKKPSMLKKHIRTHLNVRPYTCPQCMFSFKTKGNLTKHMKSQAHSKKLASMVTKSEGNGFMRAENRVSKMIFML